MRLTNERIDRLPTPAARREIADDSRPGLYLIHQPSGSKSFAVRFRMGGKHHKVTLGPFGMGPGELRLGETQEARRDRLQRDPDSESPCARDRARALFDRLALGEDPTGKQEGPADLFKNVWGRYVKSYLSGKRAATAEAAQRLFNNDLKAWHDRHVKTISKADVLSALDVMTAAGYPAKAERARAVLSKFFKWCLGRDIIKQNPCAAVELDTTTKQEEAADSNARILDDSEIAKLWKASDAMGYPFGPMVKLLLLTGCRREEIAALRDSEIDLTARTITLQPNRTKNKRKHVVHLSDAALAVLEGMDRVKNPEGYLFTTNAKNFATGYSKAKTRLDKLMGEGVPAWRLHDIRRTVVSGMARCEVELHVIERAVNHVSDSFGGIVATYQKHDYAKKTKAAFDKWGRHVASVVNRVRRKRG